MHNDIFEWSLIPELSKSRFFFNDRIVSPPLHPFASSMTLELYTTYILFSEIAKIVLYFQLALFIKRCIWSDSNDFVNYTACVRPPPPLPPLPHLLNIQSRYLIIFFLELNFISLKLWLYFFFKSLHHLNELKSSKQKMTKLEMPFFIYSSRWLIWLFMTSWKFIRATTRNSSKAILSYRPIVKE